MGGHRLNFCGLNPAPSRATDWTCDRTPWRGSRAWCRPPGAGGPRASRERCRSRRAACASTRASRAVSTPASRRCQRPPCPVGDRAAVELAESSRPNLRRRTVLGVSTKGLASDCSSGWLVALAPLSESDREVPSVGVLVARSSSSGLVSRVGSRVCPVGAVGC